MSVLRYRHLFVCIVLIAVLLSCTVMAGAEFGSGDSNNLANLYGRTNSIYNYLMTYLGGSNGIHKHLLDIKTDLLGPYGIRGIYDLLKTIDTDTGSIVTTLTSVSDGISAINSSCGYLFYLEDIDQTLDDNLSDINSSTANIDTNTEGILTFLQDLGSMNWLMTTDPDYSWFSLTGLSLFKLADIFADPNSFSLKESSSYAAANVNDFYFRNQSDITEHVFNSFGWYGGLRDFFSLPNVDISSTFEQVESGYSSWFSSGTAQALSVGAGSAAMTGISLMGEDDYVEPETPYLDAWNSEVEEILAGGDGEW